MHKFLALSLILTSTAFSATNAGANSDNLDSALSNENAMANGVVNFTQDVLLESSLPVANTPTQVRAVNSNGDFTFAGNNVIINGAGFTLNGNGANVRGFFAGGDGATLAGGSVTINDLTFSGCQVQGGGSENGGGGMGAGGGLFVYKGTKATLKDCSFVDCSVTGGSLVNGGGGGGGLGGSGGSGGGGGFGGESDFGGGGCSDFPVGNASGSTPGNSFVGGGAAGTSGVGGADLGGDGGFGGGGGDGFVNNGGFGGFGGGGGGNGGGGGFGGGGGSGSGGDGGFGGGGGKFFGGNDGGFGGGDDGGAGAGFGGAIFVMGYENDMDTEGGELTILNSVSFSGSNATAGTGLNANTDPIAGNGALGKDIFLMSGGSVIFDLTSDLFLQNPIEGNQGFIKSGVMVDTSTAGGGITKRGSALLGLTGDNTYNGNHNCRGGRASDQ